MLEVGYLNLDNPIAIISSYNNLQSNGSAGLLMLDGFDLDEMSVSEIDRSLKNVDSSSALGISVTCSGDEPLVEAARIASKNLCLLELNLSKIKDTVRLTELVSRIKRCGTTLSVRIRPENLSDDLIKALGDVGLDLIHLDLRGLNGASPKAVKKAADVHGPKIMALGDIADFDSAKQLMDMGADMVSLRGADHDFTEWLSGAMKEFDGLSGWYNAPKHICAGGDLRGLAFCCPPIKHCAVLGALNRAHMTPEEFIERKLAFAEGTPLKHGEGTCFGSLVWCCKITKPCCLRDAALVRIGLSKKDYMVWKKKLAESLFKT
ncbi:MAG: methanogenesis marker 9 domain-containing protein [Methanotrichaceae archaeon]